MASSGVRLTSSLDPFDGFVLAGGSSSRMGEDKAFVEVAGIPMIERVADSLARARTLTVIGGDARRLARLGLAHIPDSNPGSGPLGGLIDALRHCRAGLAAVVACDLPWLDQRAIENLRTSVGDADCCIPLVRGAYQWVAGVWRPDRCLPPCTAAFEEGRRSLRSVSSRLAVCALVEGRDGVYDDVDEVSDISERPCG